HGILGSNDEERLGQWMRARVDRNLPLVHGLEQSGLSFRSGAVDLIRKQNVGENRTALELELLFHSGINRDADHIRRQHVAGELYSLKGAVNGTCQGLAQRSFADAGYTFDEQVSTREDRD